MWSWWFSRWWYGPLSGQLPGGLPSVYVWKPVHHCLCMEASSSHLYDSFRLVLSFLQISLDLLVFDSRYFFFALSLSFRSLRVSADIQLGIPQGFRFRPPSQLLQPRPSQIAYLSVIGVEVSSHSSTLNRFDSSIWNWCLVSVSCSFLQSNCGLLYGFPLEVQMLVMSRMLRIRWSESSSTEL